MVLIFVAGFFLGQYVSDTGIKVVGGNSAATEMANQGDSNTEQGSDEGTQVDASMLTPEQRQLMERLGIDADSVNITPEMVACAEAKLGTTRVEEIKNGDTPSFTEGLSLASCYTTN